MGRRRRSDADHALDGLFKLFQGVPFWVGPCVAVFVYVLFRFLVPLLFQTGTGNDPAAQIGRVSDPILRNVSIGIAPWAAGLVLLVWILAEGKKLLRGRMFDAQDGIDSIRQLSWQQFEELLAEAYRRQGYAVELTGSPSGDGGVDIVLRRGREKLLVQCKHWKVYRIGVKPVRELFGVVTAERADGGILVTSGKFTDEAVEFARKSGVSLIDGKQLESLIGDLKRERSDKSTSQIQPSRTPVRASGSSAALPPPMCPQCGAPMVVRTAKKGATPGSKFWGCSQYATKDCRGKRQIV